MAKPKGHIDWLILLPIVGLMLFSIAFVYSASASIAEMRFGDSERLFINHAIRIFLGLAMIIIFARIDYHVWKKISKPLLFFAIILLIIVLFAGYNIKGASRWLFIGPLTFQPSELAKFALVVHFAAMLDKKQPVIKTFESGFLPFLFWTLVICGLIALQPNFSTTFVIYFIAMSMMFIGNTNLLHLGATTFVGLSAAGLYAVSAEYRLQRIMAFLGMDPNTIDPETVNYQLRQALIALGNGGLFGTGPGQSRQSNLFLPESYGDFIFSVIGEEYGFVGVVLIICTFALVFWRGMMVARRAPDNFGYFLAVGILITFAIYVFVNAGVNVGLLPTTGLPMPFVSYGGSAVLIYAAAVGILLNISAQSGIYPRYGTEEKIPKDIPT
jgi:cell division protein FtsW